MSTILALDQASRTTGYSVWKDGKMQTYGKFTYDNADLPQRLHQIKQRVAGMLEEYDIDKLYLEDIQLEGQFGVTTYKVLAELIGVLQELAIEKNIPVTLVPSGTWRHTCGIGGRKREERKANAKKHVLEKYNLKVTEDEADAICLGEHAINESECAW